MQNVNMILLFVAAEYNNILWRYNKIYVYFIFLKIKYVIIIIIIIIKYICD